MVKSVFCIVGTGSSFAENQNGKFGGGGQKDLHAGRSYMELGVRRRHWEQYLDFHLLTVYCDDLSVLLSII